MGLPQPNLLPVSYLTAASHWIIAYRNTLVVVLVKIVPGANAKVAVVDPEDVGLVGAHLLAQRFEAP